MKRETLHRARLETWPPNKLKAHLAAIVDGLVAVKKQAGGTLDVSPLDVVLELLGGELEAFVLFGRLGHLDPPRADGKVLIGILQRLSDDPEIDLRIRNTAKEWVTKQEARS